MYKWNLEEIISLSYLSQLSNRKLSKILLEYDCFENAQKSKKEVELRAILEQSNLFTKTILDNSQAKKDLELCHKNNINILPICDPNYPELLKTIYDPPAILYYKGQLKDLTKSISVVGTRHNSIYGKLACEEFVKQFANSGVAIVSGMASGIDSIGHQTCIKQGGYTIAVVAFGLNTPKGNIKKNVDNIIDSGGCVISQYSPNTIAKRGYFLARNRIISGLTRATLIIESGVKGGSLWTAKFALDQSREVYALPGRVFDEKSLGTLHLVAQNVAQIAISPEQILNDLGYAMKVSNNISTGNQFNDFEIEIMKHLSKNPTHIDTLLESTNFDISEILVHLLNLEFAGYVRQLQGKFYIIS